MKECGNGGDGGRKEGESIGRGGLVGEWGEGLSLIHISEPTRRA